MTAHTSSLSRPSAPLSAIGSPTCLQCPVARLSQENWIQACAARLVELGHDNDPSQLALLASDLWADVALFDPRIAAEMEHESWPCH